MHQPTVQFPEDSYSETGTGYVTGNSNGNQSSLAQGAAFSAPQKVASVSNFNFGVIHGKVYSGNSFKIDVKGSNNCSLLGTDVTEYSTSDEDSNSDGKSKIHTDILNSTLSLSNDNMYIIAEGIGKEYRKMARLLPQGTPFKSSDIFNIESSKQMFGQVEVIVEILEKWSERDPESATVGNMAKTLQKLNRTDLANKLSLKDEN